ncbi:AraC family transcriptional regulator [Proteiniclasticum sp. C24MP]|uniref:AraC family transcriptional regulator n=1 Tax=Proteiniclasticum sp. C24MP TaxID=3374101 RepID=UPI003755242C
MNHIGIDYYETKKHGTEYLPFAVYLSKIPEKLSYYPMHWHEEMEIIYVESGACLITIDGERVHAGKDDLILISPGMTHAIDQVEGCSSVYYNIIFHLEMLMTKEGKDILTENYLSPLLRGERIFKVKTDRKNSEADKMKALVDKLVYFRGSMREEGLGLLVKAALLELFYHLRVYLQDSEKKMVSLHQIEKMKELTAWLHETSAEEISLKDAAEFCGYSSSYFTKFFKNYTGASFVSYRNLIRLEKAKKLLESGEHTGLEVSGKCGFENYSYFIRAFRKQYEITPKQYQLHARRNLI